jgi:hypothetical protein
MARRAAVGALFALYASLIRTAMTAAGSAPSAAAPGGSALVVWFARGGLVVWFARGGLVVWFARAGW